MQEKHQQGVTSLNGWTIADQEAQATVLNATITLEELGSQRVRGTLLTKQGQEIHLTINVPLPKQLDGSNLVTEVCRRRRPVDILQVIMGHWTGTDRQKPPAKRRRRSRSQPPPAGNEATREALP